MDARARVKAKSSDSKRDNTVFLTRKAKSSQSENSPVDQILHLQRTIGNHAVQRLLISSAIQAKFSIGKPGNIYEKEADKIAEQVMGMSEPRVQRQVENPLMKTKNGTFSKLKFPQVKSISSPSRVQRKLEMRGSKVEDFLLLLLRITGRRFPYDSSTHLVGLPMRDPFERETARNTAVDKLNEVINDSKYTAKVYVDVQGRFPRVVIIGQLTPDIHFIDFGHIDALERAVPGAGIAQAMHEVYERYRFERLSPAERPKAGVGHPAGLAHKEALKVEIRVFREYGLRPGKRLSDDARFEGPVGRQKFIQIFRYQNFDLVIRFKADLKKAPPEFHFDSAFIQHRVRSGETLTSISRLIYGSGSRWTSIYDANRELIGDNPDFIRPGMRLIIPNPLAIR